MQHGDHNIEHELVFANHRGYVFHDSCGFEAGSENELKIVQDFVRRKSREGRLGDRLHAIWYGLFPLVSTVEHSRGSLHRYCIPMDNDRPSLEFRHFRNICPDKNGMSNRNFMNWN